MPHFGFFCFEVFAGDFRNARLAGHAFDDLDAGFFELADFFGIVRKQADFLCAEFFEDFRWKFVFAGVRGKTESFVGFDRVHALILQLIGAQLVHQADAAAFLRKIKQHTARRFRNFFERKFKLRAAIAAKGIEHVAREALRMNANQWRGFSFKVAPDESHGLFLRALSAKPVNCEVAPARRKFRVSDVIQRALFLRLLLGVQFCRHGNCLV